MVLCRVIIRHLQSWEKVYSVQQNDANENFDINIVTVISHIIYDTLRHL